MPGPGGGPCGSDTPPARRSAAAIAARRRSLKRAAVPSTVAGPRSFLGRGAAGAGLPQASGEANGPEIETGFGDWTLRISSIPSRCTRKGGATKPASGVPIETLPL